MNKESKFILFLIGINFEILNELDDFLIPREQLLDDKKYVPLLKKNFNSSFMTSLQKNADKIQNGHYLIWLDKYYHFIIIKWNQYAKVMDIL